MIHYQIFTIMKTLFHPLLWSLLFLFAGCSDANNEKNDPPQPENQLFEITVQNVKAVMAEVVVEPLDPTMTYYTDVLNDADFQQAMQYGFDDYLQWWIGELMQSYEMTYNQVVKMITSQGHEDYTLTSLNPETLYHALAVGIDADGYTTTEVVSISFTTDKAVVSNNTFEVELSEIGHYGLTVAVEPSNEDRYLLTVEPKILLEGKSDEQIAEEIINGGLAWGGIEEMLHSGSITSKEEELKPGWEYEVILFGYENGLATTPLKRVPFSALAGGDPAACQFTMTPEFEPFSTHVTIVPSDNTVVYIADVIEEEYLEMLVAEFGSEEQALAENLEALIDFYDEELGGRAASVNLITTCRRVEFDFTHKPETSYRIWAAAVDQRGNLLAPVRTTAPFRTPVEQIANAQLTLTGWAYYDGDELAAMDPETFGRAKGYAVVAASVEPSGDAATWRFYVAPGDVSDYSRKTLINNLLIAPTEDNLTEQLIVCYWGTNTIWGMAMDADGHYGELFTEVVELTKEGAMPVPDLLSGAPMSRAEGLVREPQSLRRGALRKR